MTGRWISVAPERGGRPRDRRQPADGDADREHDPECPFCPGNEEELPEILWELPGPVAPGWRVRAVPNRYPAFEAPSDDGTGQLANGLSEIHASAIEARGRQEVIIESPRHDARLATMTAEELEAVVEGQHARYAVHADANPDGRVVLFRNHGRPAGASLAHPHSQLVALPFVPPAVEKREARLEGFHEAQGRCLLCTTGDAGSGRAQRLVTETPGFRVLVPWAAEVPMEIWIVPRRHQAGFDECEPRERRELARILGRALACYRTLFGEPAYNYLLHSSPPARSGHPGHHWFAQLRPRLHQMAGFELGSGIVINPSLPEADAEVLRDSWKGEDD